MSDSLPTYEEAIRALKRICSAPGEWKFRDAIIRYVHDLREGRPLEDCERENVTLRRENEMLRATIALYGNGFLQMPWVALIDLADYGQLSSYTQQGYNGGESRFIPAPTEISLEGIRVNLLRDGREWTDELRVSYGSARMKLDRPAANYRALLALIPKVR